MNKTNIKFNKSNEWIQGFNVGVSLAQKEFLDFMESLTKRLAHKNKVSGNYRKACNEIMLELKKSLEVKE